MRYLSFPNLYVFFIIILLSFAAYANTLFNGFVWDDNVLIVENASIRSLDISDLKAFFTNSEVYNTAKGEIYRPLLLLSYAMDYKLFGLNPSGFHLTNLVFHILNSVLLYLAVGVMIQERFIALITAAVFAVHPIHTEVVAWVKSRDDLLALLFFLLALYFYIKFVHGSRFTIFLALLSYILALLSKEMAITLPFILILHDICFYPEGVKKVKNWGVYFPFFFVSGIYFIVRTIVLGQVAQADYLVNGSTPTMYTMVKGIAYYIKLLILPINLCADYLTFPISRSVDWQVALSLFVLLTIITVAVTSYRYSKRNTFSILWFFVTLLPVSNIMPLKIPIAERFLYIPSIGFCLFFATVLTWIWEAWPLSRKAISILFIILIGIYTILTIDRNKVWKDVFTLNSDIIKKYPNNTRAHHNLGTAYYKTDRLDEAIIEYKTTLRLNPDLIESRNNLGVIYGMKGMYKEAIEEFKVVLRLSPEDVKARYNLGFAYMNTGDCEAASTEYTFVLNADPKHQLARRFLKECQKKLSERK